MESIRAAAEVRTLIAIPHSALLPHRSFLHLAAGAATLPALSRTAWAQTYPARPVRIVVIVAARVPPILLPA
jgi:hypothetical protein